MRWTGWRMRRWKFCNLRSKIGKWWRVSVVSSCQKQTKNTESESELSVLERRTRERERELLVRSTRSSLDLRRYY